MRTVSAISSIIKPVYAPERKTSKNEINHVQEIAIIPIDKKSIKKLKIE